MAVYYTISINIISQEEEKREYNSEEYARTETSENSTNIDYRLYMQDSEGRTTYLGRLACQKDYNIEYYLLSGITYSDEGQKISNIICAFDSPQEAREYLNNITASTLYDHYALYRIIGLSPSNLTVELISLFPNKSDVEYYCLRRMDKNSNETIIAAIEVNEDQDSGQDLSILIEKCMRISSDTNGLYSCWHVVSRKEAGKTVEYRTFINRYSACKHKIRRKKRKQQ